MGRSGCCGTKPSPTSFESDLLGLYNAQQVAWHSTGPGSWYFLSDPGPEATPYPVADFANGISAFWQGSPIGLSWDQPSIVPTSTFRCVSMTESSGNWAVPTAGSRAYSITLPYTMAAFFQIPAGATQVAICSMHDTFSGNGARAALYADATGHLIGGQDIAGGAFSTVTGPLVNDGSTHWAALRNDGTNVHLYLDGSLVGSVAASPQPTDTCWLAPAYASAGDLGAQFYGKGTLQHVTMLNFPLTDAQVIAIYGYSGL